MLVGRGFKKVYNLQGGIQGWNGLEAEGPVELNMDMISGDETPSEIIKLAYAMEQSLGEFYRVAKTKTKDDSVVGLLDRLASIEEKHKQYLLELYNELGATPASVESFDDQAAEQIMEGGFRTNEFMRRNERFLSDVRLLLDLAMMLEAQALDLYLRFADKTENERTKSVLHRIGDEEKTHLIALGKLRDQHP
ncbi:MAG: ferritin-like domain-containing protein [Desulfomonile tiedjei]|uniref:Ferritin-like domain-containing protein n=1 Tax=Desulfomonile tiedjei TaxID=2358 RepID=A0A9D6V6I5_9BACT|nr:ferritin-like domain-containing protein [Desulfomonile tiedjei]